MTSLDARPPVGVEVLERRAARALILDDRERVLLFEGIDPAEPERGRWWFTPGGGIDPGEDHHAGLIREVSEETGLLLDSASVGEPVWWRRAEFLFAGRWYRQHEQFFLVRVPQHVVDTSGFTALEVSSVLGHRWWDLADLAASADLIYPVGLATELRSLLLDGSPSAPYEVG